MALTDVSKPATLGNVTLAMLGKATLEAHMAEAVASCEWERCIELRGELSRVEARILAIESETAARAAAHEFESCIALREELRVLRG
jgi:excinuclease UvrABC helicase subunit UvrB